MNIPFPKNFAAFVQEAFTQDFKKINPDFLSHYEPWMW